MYLPPLAVHCCFGHVGINGEDRLRPLQAHAAVTVPMVVRAGEALGRGAVLAHAEVHQADDLRGRAHPVVDQRRRTRGVEAAEGAAAESSDVVRPGTRPVRTTDEAVPGALGVGDGRVRHCDGARRGELAREQRPGGRVEQLVGLLLVGDVLRLDALDHVTVQIGHLPGVDADAEVGVVRVTGRTTGRTSGRTAGRVTVRVAVRGGGVVARFRRRDQRGGESEHGDDRDHRVATRAEPAHRGESRVAASTTVNASITTVSASTTVTLLGVIRVLPERQPPDPAHRPRRRWRPRSPR